MNKLPLIYFSCIVSASILAGCNSDHDTNTNTNTPTTTPPHPVARNVSVTLAGEMQAAPGNSLSAAYTYEGSGVAEQKSLFVWRTKEEKPRILLAETGTESTSPELNLGSDNVQSAANHKIEFCVIPRNSAGKTGNQVCASNDLTLKPPQHAPEATDVTVTDLTSAPVVGKTLSATYVFNDQNNDAEEKSHYEWRNENNAVIASSQGVQNNEHKLTLDQTGEDLLAVEGHKLKFCVSPRDVTGTAGIEVCSAYTDIVQPKKGSHPVASESTIKGTPQVGKELLGEYTYKDEDGDSEGPSKYDWKVKGKTVSIEKRYTPKKDDAYNKITFCVTPVAQTGTPNQGTETCVTSGDNIIPAEGLVPELNDLTLTTPKSILAGGTVEAKSNCTNCDSAKTEYTWYVDRNDNGVFTDQDEKVGTGSTYTLITQDELHPIRLEAQAHNADNVSALQSKGVKPLFVEKVFMNTYAENFGIKNDGSFVTISRKISPSNKPMPSGLNNNDVASISDAFYATAVLKKDKSVVTWGKRKSGGENNSGEDLTNVDRIFHNSTAFAAIKNKSGGGNEVVTWGNKDFGGVNNSGEDLTNVKTIVSSEKTFTALKNDADIVIWGYNVVRPNLDEIEPVKEIYATSNYTAALDSTDTVTVWESSINEERVLPDINRISNVDKVLVVNGTAFILFKQDGKLEYWGHKDILQGLIYDLLPDEVEQFISTQCLFSVLKKDKSVETWYSSETGDGQKCSNTVEHQRDLSNVDKLFTNGSAVVALKEDQSLVAWGNKGTGGDPNAVNQLTKVKAVASNESAFAALMEGGDVAIWGRPHYGGSIDDHEKLKDVEKLYSNQNQYIMAAQRKDKSIVIWGQYGPSDDQKNDLLPVWEKVGQAETR